MPRETTVDSPPPIPQSSLRARVVRQFGRPTGLPGHLAGWVMALRSSNRRRSLWTVDQLSLQPGNRVLEVGFGPGLALAHAAAHVGAQGQVVGVDASEVMLAHASRRNAAFIGEGRMALRLGSVEALPDLGDAFDAIFAVNSIGFWPDPPARLQGLAGRLVPGGRLAITVQPRSRDATAATSDAVRRRLETDFATAGLDVVGRRTLDLTPPAVCVIGTRRG